VRLSILIISYLIIVSCGPQAIFDEEQTIPEGVWAHDNGVQFNINSPDTTAIYDIILELTHSEEYAYENVYLLITTKFPNTDKIEDQLSIDLIAEDGSWLGQGSSVKRLKVFLQEKVRLNQIGKYGIQFNQYSREDSLSGIEKLRLLLYQTSI